MVNQYLHTKRLKYHMVRLVLLSQNKEDVPTVFCDYHTCLKDVKWNQEQIVQPTDELSSMVKQLQDINLLKSMDKLLMVVISV